MKRSAGYAITADAAIGCPLAPALVADLNRYGSGAAFADAVLSAKRLARSGCVQRLWRRTFSPPGCPNLRGYLAEPSWWACGHGAVRLWYSRYITDRI